MKLGECRCSDDSTRANMLARLIIVTQKSNIGVAMQ